MTTYTNQYSPYDWFWSVQDSSPSTQVWKSRTGAFVAFADADYIAFLAAGNTATSIDTAVNLYQVINAAALSIANAGQGNGNETHAGGSADIVLTNPLVRNQRIEILASGKSVTLPQMNLPISCPIGFEIVIVNLPANSFDIKGFGGGGIVTVPSGQVLRLVLSANDTQAGTFVFSWEGVAQGSMLDVSLGGTGANMSASGGASQFLRQNSTGAIITVVQPAFTDISGSVAAAQLPNPSSSTLGGIRSLAAVASKWINTISTSGVPSATQPAATDLSDYLATTFTPVLAFGGASVGITYGTQTGTYTRIGNRVFFEITIILTSKGSSVGTATIAALPVTPAGTAPATWQVNNMAAAVTTAVQGAITSGSTSLVPQRMAAGAATNMADTDFNNNSVMRIAGCYPS